MDKYKILENKLNDIIAKLNKDIAEKQKEAATKSVIYKEEETKKEEIAKDLKDTKNNLRFLKIFENKNIFITALIECNKHIGKSIKDADTFETLITIVLLLFLVFASIFEPLLGVVIASIIALFESLFAILANREVKKIRKKASIPELEKKITSLEEELSKKEKQEKQENKELANMLYKINSLIAERDLYLKDLAKVKETRMQVLEQILDVDLLNEIYDKTKIEENLNIRTRKK